MLPCCRMARRHAPAVCGCFGRPPCLTRLFGSRSGQLRTATSPAADAAPTLLDLAKGHPDPSLLPRAVLAEACAQAAREFAGGSTEGLRYGSRPNGSDEFLRELADFIGRQCAGEAPARAADGLLLTNGVSHGLELALSVFARPGDAVLVEAPSYFLAVGIFEAHGLEVVPVPTDAQGLSVDDVEGVLDARRPGSRPVRFLYTVPAGHNPTGSSLPAERRRRLVDVARRRGLLILADEVYHMLDWHHPRGERPPRMVCFDEAYVGIPPSCAPGGRQSLCLPLRSWRCRCGDSLHRWHSRARRSVCELVHEDLGAGAACRLDRGRARAHRAVGQGGLAHLGRLQRDLRGRRRAEARLALAGRGPSFGLAGGRVQLSLGPAGGGLGRRRAAASGAASGRLLRLGAAALGCAEGAGHRQGQAWSQLHARSPL
mmetsp:Transcript_14903/g.52293  ORF Transcript_14903/g.52293 Transcript_14903/m.52293 type:complete len:429 (-) Transcript_14903:128-1414(-)